MKIIFDKQEFLVMFLWALVGFVSWFLHLNILRFIYFPDIYLFAKDFFGFVFSDKIILYASMHFFEAVSIFITALVLGVFFQLNVFHLLIFFIANRAFPFFFMIDELIFHLLQNSGYFIEFIKHCLSLLLVYFFLFVFAWLSCLSGRRIGALMFNRNSY
ncbi:hypothetical protein OOT00_15935 [Desulfobotulus sp. H1]|uniref:Uncharacterized protein n=1 Tax=Desulfobotulus pelophilus TaxID=2823377 RepID=A0ABT3NDC0_9BACT|nr:hypothetical protein [Desulfobotulus pelophilus]MCW7755466.1 hypothetical protein [Desulfobotulus pelophilus]